MFIIELEISTEARLMHALKAEAPMLVTELGIVTEVRLLQF
jgi:hypothetical protein